MHRRLLHVEQGVDHGHVDVRALAGAVAAVEGVADAGEGVDPGVGVAHTDTDEGGRTIRVTGHVHDAGVRLGDEVEARLVPQRPGLAEARKPEHDETGVRRAKLLKSQPPFLQRPGAEILDQALRGGDQAQQQEHAGGGSDEEAAHAAQGRAQGWFRLPRLSEGTG